MYKDIQTRKFMAEFEEVMKRENLSQNKLAKLIGMQPQTITQIKHKKQSIQVDILKKFSQMFGYDFSFFYNEDSDNRVKVNSQFQIDQQLELIRKNNETLIQLCQTGLEIINAQMVCLENLKKMTEE